LIELQIKEAAMSPLPTTILEKLFFHARTHKGWQPKPVSDDLLRSVYDLAKWAPTSVNSNPMRVVFVKSVEAKEKLMPALLGSNGQQVKEASATAIICHDTKFYDELPRLMPAFDARSGFVKDPAMAAETAFRNGSLQGAYFMIAARALGLDVGPMSGFKNEIVDELFLKGTTWKSNFLCNVGYGIPEKLYPRGPRLNFHEAARIL
jgi:3-hydroxypropanoate dehydrogenase